MSTRGDAVKMSGGTRRDCDDGNDRHPKIGLRHLDRAAYIYIRQSTQQQITGNQESTKLQYNLARRAEEFGWQRDRIVVIDEDLGKSAQTADDRSGFQKLLTEVGLDHVGIIFGIEMSRLARSCKDWYHLLELCGMFGCLLADVDGVYDPTNYNDRLLLGLKGTMSEAELHVMRGRLLAGKLNKAKRGELFSHVPAGYVRLASGSVAFDPDEQVCSVVRLIFGKFAEIGSLNGLLQYLVKHGITIGMHLQDGDSKGELVWRRPNQATLGHMLHNPFFAGAYAYGRSHFEARHKKGGKPYSGEKQLPMDEWEVLIKDLLPAYITWDQYLANQKRLAANATRYGARGVPREGHALLPGLLKCRKCDFSLAVQYSKQGFFQYSCCRGHQSHGDPCCQSFSGQVIDAAVSAAILHAIEPASLDLTLAATRNVEKEREDIDRNWRQRIERVAYVVGRAERQYQKVEPENRLVARSLERAWEEALAEERNLRDDYERFKRDTPQRLSVEEIALIRRLAIDLPALWNTETTSPRDRQIIAQLLIDRIYVDTHDKTNLADVDIEWKGGHISHHRISHHVRSYKRRHDFEDIKARIAGLRDEGYTQQEIADTLNNEGYSPAKNAGTFKAYMITGLVQTARLPKLRDGLAFVKRQLRCDEWALSSLSRELAIPYQTMYAWLGKGWLKARQLDDKQRHWAIFADKKEQQHLRDLYRSHPQNHWEWHHEKEALT